MKSSAIAGRQFLKFEKTAENAGSNGIGSNLSGANQLRGSPHFARTPIFAKTNKNPRQLVGWPRITHFAICPGTLKFFCTKCNAVSKASPNFSSEEYRQRFRIKRRGVSLMVSFLL